MNTWKSWLQTAQENCSDSRERLAILNQASRVVNTASMDPEQIYIAIHTATAWLMPTDVFSIILVDEAHGKFEEVYLATPEGRQVDRARIF